MNNWMQALASHYESARIKYPEDKLLILFDIDGTILDMRYTVMHLLRSYDEQFETNFFENLAVTDITFHDDMIAEGLQYLAIPEAERESIVTWYNKHRWSNWAIFEANRSFPGVMEVIRWFQIQPHTYVGLNTGRPECLREETLASLNQLGREFRVVFSDELLQMNGRADGSEVAQGKVAAIQRLSEKGYRVITMIDNEPYNLDTIAEMPANEEILLLHASTIFKKYQRGNVPVDTVNGNIYDLTELIPKRALPRHIQFVWDGVNNEVSLNKFIESNIHWADISRLARPYIEKKITDKHLNESLLNNFLIDIRSTGKGIRLELTTEQAVPGKFIDRLAEYNFRSDAIWFSANIEDLRADGFRQLTQSFPGSIIESPIDFLAPLVVSVPEKAEAILDTLSEWGINRFSLDWKNPQVKLMLEVLEDYGFDITLTNVSGLESFLQATLLMPRAIVSDFSFPKWEYEEKYEMEESRQRITS